VGPRAGLDAVSKRKILSPRRKSNLDHPNVQPVASRYTDCAIQAHNVRTVYVQMAQSRRNPTYALRGVWQFNVAPCLAGN
jgi:hypothetical protein